MTFRLVGLAVSLILVACGQLGEPNDLKLPGATETNVSRSDCPDGGAPDSGACADDGGAPGSACTSNNQCLPSAWCSNKGFCIPL